MEERASSAWHGATASAAAAVGNATAANAPANIKTFISLSLPARA